MTNGTTYCTTKTAKVKTSVVMPAASKFSWQKPSSTSRAAPYGMTTTSPIDHTVKIIHLA